jgi:hypothetical protein
MWSTWDFTQLHLHVVVLGVGELVDDFPHSLPVIAPDSNSFLLQPEPLRGPLRLFAPLACTEGKGGHGNQHHGKHHKLLH